MHLKNLALTAALAIGATALILPSAFAQDHPDYSKNKYYQMGNKEGLQDHQKNVQRPTHNHNYKSDDDRRAHDEGYKLGFQGTDYRVVVTDHH